MRPSSVLALITGLTLASTALADFAGQPILGPLTPGGFASGSTSGDADDNDGWDSGQHIFDIWDGGDDVFRLDWPGGTMVVTLDSLQGADNDLFVYRPTDLDSSNDFSTVGAHDVVTIVAAPAGQYFINVDSTFFSEGSYQLSVAPVPAPASAVMLGIGALACVRRRR